MADRTRSDEEILFGPPDPVIAPLTSRSRTDEEILFGPVGTPEPDPAPTGPGLIEEKVNYYNAISDFGPLQSGELGSAFREVLVDPSRSDMGVVSEIYGMLGAAGVVDTKLVNQALDPSWITTMRDRANRNVDIWLTKSGLDKSLDGESFKDKRILRRQALAFEAIAGAPVDPKMLSSLTHDVAMDLVDRRIEELRKSGGVGTEQYQRWTANRARLAQLPRSEWATLYRNTLYDLNTRPVNSLEAKTLEAEQSEHWGPFNLRLFGPPEPGSDMALTARDVTAIMRDVLGDNAAQMLQDEVVKNKVRYIRERLGGGLQTDDGKIVTGKRIEGQNFLMLAPTGAAERLIARGIADTTAGRAQLNAIRQEQGPIAAIEQLRLTADQHMTGAMSKLADEVQQPTLYEEMPITDKVRQELSLSGRLGNTIMDVLGHLGMLGKTAFESADRIVTEQPFIRNMLAKKTTAYFSWDPTAADRARTIGEILSTIWTTNTTMLRRSFGELRLRSAELGYSNMFDNKEGGWVEGQWAAARNYGKPGALIESFPNMYKQVDKNNQILSDFQRQPFSVAGTLKALWAAMGNTGYMLFAAPMEMAAAIGEDPHEVGGFLAQGLALSPLTRVTSGWAGRASARLSYTGRLAWDLDNLVAFHPEQLGRFKEAATRMLATAKLPEAKVKVLNDLVAHVESFERSRAMNGVEPHKSETARVLRRAFPELREELGTFGHTLGTAQINRGFAADVAPRLASWLGQKMPAEGIEALMGNIRTTDLAINVLSDLTGAKGVAQALNDARVDFVKQNRREPTPDELSQIAPKPIKDLYGLMVTAEKWDLKMPVHRALWNKIVGGGYDAAGIVESASGLLNEYMSTSLRLVERVRNLGIVRERTGLVIDLARTKMQLGIEEMAMELDLTRKVQKTLVPTEATVLDGRIKALEDNILTHRRHIERLNLEEDTMWRAEPSKPWAMDPEVQALIYGPNLDGVGGHVNASSLGLLLDLHPGLFEGFISDGLFKTKRTPLSPAETGHWKAAMRRRSDTVEATRKALKAAEKNPASVDRALAEMSRQKTDLEAKLKEVLARPADDATAFTDGQILPPDKNVLARKLQAEIADLDTRIQSRAQKLKDGSEISPEVMDLEADLGWAQAEQMQLGGAYQRAKDMGHVVERSPDVQTFRNLQRLFRHEGMGAAEAILEKMKGKLRQGNVNHILGVNVNPFAFEMAPVWYRGELLHQQFRSGGWRLASAMERVERGIDFLLSRPQVEREALARAFVEGRADPITKLNLPQNTKENLATYWERETATYREMWSILDDVGKIPKSTIESWKKGNYDPRISGLYMREYSAKGAAARQALGGGKHLPKNPELTSMGMDWTEFMFRREPGKWRLRVQQPDVIVDKLFDTEEALNTFLTDRYGEKALRDLGAWEGDGTRRGRTFHGEPVTVGRPITPLEMEIEDPIGRTPEARLVALRKAMKDAHLHLLNEGLNQYGDMILTPEQAEAAGFLTNPDVRRSYVEIPAGEKARMAFGNLAGKWVHRTVLRELGEASRVYDHLGSLADGWRLAVEENALNSTKVLDWLNLKTNKATRAYRELTSIVKDNLILKSSRTWMANALFWLVSDHLAGTRVLSLEHIGTLLNRLREYGSGKALEVMGDSMVARARRQGITSGGLMGAEAMSYGEMARKIMGIENKASVEATLARRQALYDKIRDLRLTDGVGAEQIASVQRELVSLKLILADMNRNWLAKTVSKAAGFFRQTKTVSGAPQAPIWTKVRGFYNWLDSAFKVAQFEYLVNQGMDDVTAGNVVRRFTQDYANLPSWIRQGNPWIMSLVPAFPHELTKIFANAVKFAPTRFFSLMAALPMLNLMNFTLGGIGWDRAIGLIAARGKKDTLQATLSLFNTVYLTDPTSGEITDEINVGSYFPGANLLQSRGFASRLYDKWLPPEKRGMSGQLSALGINFASNFFGSNILLNAGGGTLMGVDPLTGEPVINEKDSPWHNIKTLGRLLGQQTLPPVMPGGRDWDAIQTAAGAAPSPKTGRMFKAEQSITAWSRAILGVTWRGKKIQEISNALGLTSRPPMPLVRDYDLIMSDTYRGIALFGNMFGLNKIPTMGEYNEIRELAYASVDSALTEEQRTAALAEAKKLFLRESYREVNGLKLSAGETDREFRNWIERTLDRDPLQTFKSQNILVQSFVLASADKKGVRDGIIRDLVAAMQLTDLGAIKSPADEEMIDKAVALLDQHIAENGRYVNDRLRKIRDYIDVDLRIRAKVKEIQEEVRSPANLLMKGIFRAPAGGSPDKKTPSMIEEAARSVK